jgi:hypothetical protein
MGAALWAFLAYGPADPILQSLIGVPLGVAVYAILAWGLRVDQLRIVVRMILRRVG